ncbi:MAG: DUF6089 family protein [Bacteroidales bacterium]
MKISTSILLTLLSSSLIAQEYNYEGGLTIGASSYIGEVEKYPFSNINSNYGLMFRYNANLRNAIKFSIEKVNIRGDGNINSYEQGFHYSFKKTLIDLGIQYEYNFFSFSDRFEYMESKRFSPYITTGVGVIIQERNNISSNNVDINIPFGVGVKYKIYNRINLGAEFTMKWTSSDHIDGISNPTKGSTTWYKNKDWYSISKFFISIDFGRKKCDCPRDK